MHTCLFAVYSLGHPATCIHRHTLLYARTLIFTPSFHHAHPHYPSVLTESFSRPGHCKCCLPNTDMLKDTPPLLTLFFFFFLTAPILYCSLHPISVSLCSSLSVIKMNLESVFCVFRSLVSLCKFAVSFNLVTRAGMKSKKKYCEVHNPRET